MKLHSARSSVCSLFGLLWLSAVQPTAAADLMDSPACHEARAALHKEELRMGAASAPDKAPWLALRQRVAKACLGPAASSPAPRRGAVTAPDSVPPVTLRRAAPATATPSTTGSPAPRQEPLRAITSCDAAGCWTSDGGRVQRMGPDLVGPRGVCTVQGAVISCP